MPGVFRTVEMNSVMVLSARGSENTKLYFFKIGDFCVVLNFVKLSNILLG